MTSQVINESSNIVTTQVTDSRGSPLNIKTWLHPVCSAGTLQLCSKNVFAKFHISYLLLASETR